MGNESFHNLKNALVKKVSINRFFFHQVIFFLPNTVKKFLLYSPKRNEKIIKLEKTTLEKV